MLKVNVNKAGSLDKALKQLKRKVRNTKQNQELRDRQEFKKPSEKRREEKKNAIRKQKYNNDNS